MTCTALDCACPGFVDSGIPGDCGVTTDEQGRNPCLCGHWFDEHRQARAEVTEARKRGADAGRAAGSWAADGNTSGDHAARVLAMIDAGDPAADDSLPRRPNLSGEFADDPTPQSLARELTGDDDPDADLIDAIADAYEEGVDATFQDACANELRRHLPNDPPDETSGPGSDTRHRDGLPTSNLGSPGRGFAR